MPTSNAGTPLLATTSLPPPLLKPSVPIISPPSTKTLQNFARPLGIGFSWRRLLASTVLKHASSSNFAAPYLRLVPQGQLGVGVPAGGIDTIVHLIRSAVESNIAAL
jgi:hypothetical protein